MLFAKLFGLTLALLGFLLVSNLAAQPEVLKLELDVAINRNLVEGEQHSYSFAANEKDFVSVAVEQKNADIRLTILAPGGQQIYQIDNANNREESEKAIFIAATSGEFTAEISFVGNLAGSVIGKSYEIRLGAKRLPTEKDQILINGKKVYDQANQLRFQTDEASRRASLTLFLQAAARFAESEDRLGEAFAHFARGQVNSLLSDYANSKNGYEKAIVIFRELNARPQLAMTLEAAAPIFFRENNQEKSLELLNEALQIYKELNYRKGVAKITGNFGAIYSQKNQPRRALEFYLKALALLEAERDKSGAGRIFNNLGLVYDGLGEPAKAVEYFAQGLRNFEELGDGYMQANILTNQAAIYKNLGEPEKAVELGAQALAMFETRGDKNGQANSFNNLAAASADLGDLEKSREFYQKALILNREIKSRSNEAMVLLNFAALLADKNDLSTAETLLLTGLQIFRELKNRLGESQTLVKLGEITQKRGDLSQALAYFQQALPVLREIENRDWEGLTLYLIGDTWRLMGNLPVAKEFCEQALQIKRFIQQPGDEAQILFSLARIESGLNNFEKARQDIENALEIVEISRAKLSRQDFRASYFFSKTDFYEFYVNLLIRQGLNAEALQASERARARNLLQSLSENGVSLSGKIPAELIEKEASLRELINAKDTARIRAASLNQVEKQAEFKKELDLLMRSNQIVQAQIRIKNPNFSQLIQPQPLSLKQIQTEVLDADSVLLEYFLGAECSVLFVADQQGLETFELPAAAVIEKTARRFYENLKSRSLASSEPETTETREERIKHADAAAEKDAAELSRILLAPATDKLQNKRLLIVGSGILQYIPFAALPKPIAQQDSKYQSRFLIETNEIVNLPSASALAAMRSAKQKNTTAKNQVAILADPVFSRDDVRLKLLTRRNKEKTFPAAFNSPVTTTSKSVMPVAALPPRLRADFARLRFSRREAAVIASFAPRDKLFVALDFAANRQTASSKNIQNARVVHFATHGFVNSDFPELSGIVLSLVDATGAPQDGFLRLHDVYNLRFDSELIVLSACETALGKEIRGEGIVGLTRGFMHAGASSVMASLWKVDDRATSELMTLFYEKMLDEKFSPAAALRAAQIKMANEKTTRAPFYWAAFTLQGDWR